MSLKRRFEYQSNQFVSALTSISIPEWMTGTGMRVGLTMCVILFGVMYMAEISRAATGSYRLRDQENAVAQLNVEIQKLEVAVAEQGSLVAVRSRLPELGMARVDAVKVVMVGGGVVATR